MKHLVKINSFFIGFLLALFPFGLFAAEGGDHPLNVLKEVVFPYLNLFILLGFFIYFLRRPAKDFFLERSKKIAQSIEESAREEQEAEAHYLNFDRRLKNIESEVDDLMKSLKKEGELAKQRIIEEAHRASERIGQTAKWIVEQEIKKTKERLKETTLAKTVQSAEALIRQHLKSTDREQMVQKTIRRLEELV